MNTHPSELHFRAATLADVIERLENNSRLSPTRRRDLVSAVTCTARLIDRQPFELAADVGSLREKLLAIHPVQAGITAKRLANIKSDLNLALRITRAAPRMLPKCDPSPAWVAFLEQITVPHQRWSLSRLVTFCAYMDIEPDDVDDGTMVAFQAYLDATVLTKAPDLICNAMAQTWNGIVTRNGLPLRTVTLHRSDQYRAPPLSIYPVSLRDDITAYLDRLSHADLLSEEGPVKPLRPISVRNIEAHLRQFLDAVVMAGHAPEDFHGLADLTEVAVVKAGLLKIIERNGGKNPVGLQNMAGTLLAIAGHYVEAPPPTIKDIQKIKSRTSIDLAGMTEKNMARLGQFDDPHNVVRLVGLPEFLMKRAGQNPTSSRSALDAMYAVAITLLLSCPMRVGNLASLDLEHLLTHTQKGSQHRYSVRIEGRDVKNHNPIDFDLGQYQSRILQRYLRNFRGLLSEAPGNALFPMRSGGPRPPSHLSQGLSNMIHRETGLKMNAHLFRHLAGMLYLEQNPGDYETVRRLLGHRKLDTTTSFYARFDSKWALNRYDETVLSKWRQP